MDSQVFDIISKEAKRQSSTIELIASENHVSSAVTEAVGSCFTNKYAEGYPGSVTTLGVTTMMKWKF